MHQNYHFPEYVGGPWDGGPVQAVVGNLQVPETPGGYYYWDGHNYIWLVNPPTATAWA